MKIDIENMKFSYDKDRNIINNFNLSIYEFDNLAFVGASGCGKTTLLKLISGIYQKEDYKFYEGEISLNNKPPSKMIEQGLIGFMFQDASLLPFLTVRQNIELPLTIKGKNQLNKSFKDLINDSLYSFLGQFENNPTSPNELIDQLMKMVGLFEFQHLYPSQLSGGMKTRTSLARTMITLPKMLFLDEPFSSLDVNWKNLLYKDLNNFKEISKSNIILVTHDIIEALTLANNIVIMGNNGTMEEHLVINNKLPRDTVETICQLGDRYEEIYYKLLSKKVRNYENGAK